MIKFKISQRKTRYIGLLFTFIVLTAFTCAKEEPVPEFNPQGDYVYESHADYTDNDDPMDYSISYGELDLILEYNKAILEVTPNSGFPFSITAINLKTQDDTTTFDIYRQSVKIHDIAFDVHGTENIQCGSFGKFDGFFTKNSIIFEYVSYKSSGGFSSITSTTARKKE